MNSTPFIAPATRRLQASPVAPPSSVKAHLIFAVDGEYYACPIENIEHVLRRSDANVQPRSTNCPPWEVGRLARQTNDVPVISLRVLWGLPDQAAETGREALLVINLPDQSFALLVDECRTVISSLPPGTARFPLPTQLRGTRGAAFDTAIHWQNQLIVTVQLQKLLSSEFDGLLAPGREATANL
jgi:chemotaxis signal transduction protein